MKSLKILVAFGILNFIAWNFAGIVVVVNIALLFLFLDLQKEKNIFLRLLLGYIWLLIFNVSSLFWLIKVDGYDAILTLLANALLFLPAIVVFYLVNSKYKYFLFITSYLVLEVVYSFWNLAFPWLNLGQVMGNQWYLVQWYSIVGAFGGSFWLLFSGLYLYKMMLSKNKNDTIYFTISLLLPLISIVQFTFFSYSRNTYTDIIKVIAYNPLSKTTKYNVTKEMYIKLSNKGSIDFVVTPELFYEELYPSELKEGIYADYFKFFHQKNPKTTFIIGTELFNNEKIKFNGIAAVTEHNTLFRTKKRYVPIREYTPPLLRKWYSNYYQKNNNDDESKMIELTKIFPLVCYESIFTTFVASKSQNVGALFLLTSERFMNGSDFGKRQYLNIVRLRAIENNKPILKVSDDGISCLLLPNGSIETYIVNEIEEVEIELSPKQSMYSKIINGL
ncbi:hypothetical protein H7F37_13380 [Winogradskyella sp. PAMC22761]|nr:hypothetical protein H7F37_13380 [Winogradskyella sp. PAMC22761]